jgi:hypothetical protein
MGSQNPRRGAAAHTAVTDHRDRARRINSVHTLRQLPQRDVYGPGDMLGPPLVRFAHVDQLRLGQLGAEA